jgi:hypothetical protein
MGPPRKRRKITSTTREIESRNDAEQLSELNPVTVPDSVSPNTNQIRANHTTVCVNIWIHNLQDCPSMSIITNTEEERWCCSVF